MTEVKTCSEWYALDTTRDIIDPDGFFRSSKAAPLFWYYVPVTKDFYEKRCNRCSLMSYNAMSHRPPYEFTFKLKQSFDVYWQHPLSSLIFSVLLQDTTS